MNHHPLHRISHFTLAEARLCFELSSGPDGKADIEKKAISETRLKAEVIKTQAHLKQSLLKLRIANDAEAKDQAESVHALLSAPENLAVLEALGVRMVPPKTPEQVLAMSEQLLTAAPDIRKQLTQELINAVPGRGILANLTMASVDQSLNKMVGNFVNSATGKRALESLRKRNIDIDPQAAAEIIVGLLRSFIANKLATTNLGMLEGSPIAAAARELASNIHFSIAVQNFKAANGFNDADSLQTVLKFKGITLTERQITEQWEKFYRQWSEVARKIRARNPVADVGTFPTIEAALGGDAGAAYEKSLKALGGVAAAETKKKEVAEKTTKAVYGQLDFGTSPTRRLDVNAASPSRRVVYRGLDVYVQRNATTSQFEIKVGVSGTPVTLFTRPDSGAEVPSERMQLRAPPTGEDPAFIQLAASTDDTRIVNLGYAVDEIQRNPDKRRGVFAADGFVLLD